jgi:hypothetical protein
MWANRSRSLPRQVCELGEEVRDTGVIERIEISSKTGLALWRSRDSTRSFAYTATPAGSVPSLEG